MATTIQDSNDPYLRASEIFPVLSEEQVESIRPFARLEHLKTGDYIFHRGQRSVDFFVVSVFRTTPGR